MGKQEVFKTVIAMQSEIYGNQISSAARKIWWSILSPYTAEQIADAMERHMRDPDSGRFPPKPADLIGKITGNSKQQDISIEDAAMKEWEKIKEEIRSVGAYGRYNSDDKVSIKAIQSLGGWVALCHAPIETLDTWKRKEFISAYKIFVNAKDLPRYAPGIGQKSHEAIEAKLFMDKLGEKLKGSD